MLYSEHTIPSLSYWSPFLAQCMGRLARQSVRTHVVARPILELPRPVLCFTVSRVTSCLVAKFCLSLQERVTFLTIAQCLWRSKSRVFPFPWRHMAPRYHASARRAVSSQLAPLHHSILVSCPSVSPSLESREVRLSIFRCDCGEDPTATSNRGP